ncbi:MAG: MFS transporter, partial [Nitrososphaerales archaeon]|nr:MFS transporter [Nitrososphaerales archaeon]
MAESTRAGRAIAVLVMMRIIYAINWLNIGAIFYAMEPDFHAGVLGLGTLTSGFYLGVGLMQVPGGILAARWGPKKIVVLGTMISSVSAVATGFAPGLAVATALRFLVGGGMAFVFAPAVVIIARLLREGRSGLGVGLFNSAFNVGGIFALFLWGVIAGLTGWRLSVELSGGLGVVSGLLVMTTVPVDEANLEFRVRGQQLRKVLADSRLIIIGLGMLGVSAGNGLASSFMVYYLIGVFGLSAAQAGIIASMLVAVPIFSAVYAGHVYDRMKRP